MPRIASWRFLLAIALLLGACADLRDMMGLQQDLARKFGATVSVSLSNHEDLTIAFVNAGVSDSQKTALCRQAAEFVRDHYDGYGRLRGIDVAFSSVKGGGGVTVSSTARRCRFSVEQLGPPRSPGDSGEPDVP